MHRFIQFTYVACMLAIAAAGTANMVSATVKDVPLTGVETDAPAPEFSLGNVRREIFQRAAVPWFEQHWGLRGYAVRTDNTVNIDVFGETRSGQIALVGKGGVAFTKDDVTYLDRIDPPEDAVKAAQYLATVQAKMRRRGIVVLPVILPAKTTPHRAAVPDAWQRAGVYERADTTIYRTYVETLTNERALFVDGRAILMHQAKEPHDIFWESGRHLRLIAACRVLQAIIETARRELPQMGNETIDCSTHIEPNPSIYEEDFDLHRLLNVWTPPPPQVHVDVLDGPRVGDALHIPTLYVGSSFMWKFAFIANRLELFKPSIFYYYNQSIVSTEGSLPTLGKVEPGSDRWRDDVFGKKLIIMGLLESFLPWDSQDFLKQIDRELDRSE